MNNKLFKNDNFAVAAVYGDVALTVMKAFDADIVILHGVLPHYLSA